MNWLADILKNLTISKTLVAAVFVTSAVMYIGPVLGFDRIPRLQPEFVPYLFAVMLFTGCLLLFWGMAVLWNLTRIGMRNATQFFANSSTLYCPEAALLFLMSQDPTQSIDLDKIDYSHAPGTKLEFHHWTKKLEIRGLARINEYNDNLVSLTDLGRKRALKVQKQFKSGNVP